MNRRRVTQAERMANRRGGVGPHVSEEPLSGSDRPMELKLQHSRDWAEVSVTVLLLVVSSPLFLIAALLPVLADGGPILWRGERLGKGRRPFTMYKLRSLAPGAEELIGARMITPPMAAEMPLEHRFGRFLRDSHLDELPQFFNVLKNEMSLLGPRPIRRELYEAECRHLPDYDRRFSVKPGLFGYSQVLTPHSTDKRIRKKLDNHFIGSRPSAFKKVLFLLSVLFVLGGRLPVEAVRSLRQFRKSEYRKRYRVGQSKCGVFLQDGLEAGSEGIVENVNDMAMSVSFEREVMDMGTRIKIETRAFQLGRMRSKQKTVYCEILATERRPSSNKSFAFGYVIRYQPASPLNHYLIQKYLLRLSLI